MTAHRFLVLALVFGAAAQNVMDDATFESVSRELEVDMSAEASDVDDAFRRLSGNATTTAGPTTTQAPLRVEGDLELSGFTDAEATAFVDNAAAKLALKTAIASQAGSSVGADAVTLTLTIENARRLGEIDAAEPRALQAMKKIHVQYVITFPAGATLAEAEAIAATLRAVENTAFATAINDALTAAGVTAPTLTVENLGAGAAAAGATVAPTTTTPPPVDGGATKMAATSSMLVLLSAWLFSA